jgi:uncharacterized membrane protein YfcA
MPLMALVMPPIEAAAIMLPILMAQDVISVITYRRSFNRRILFVLLAGGFCGIALGAALAAHVSNALIEFIVGLIASTFVLYTWARRKHPVLGASQKPGLVSGLFWGTCAGFTSFIANAGAPPFQVYVLPQRLPPQTYAGTGTMFFATVNLVKFVAFGFLGQVSLRHLELSAVLLPPAIASTFFGIWLVRRVESDRFYAIAYGLTLVVGLYLVWIGGRALLET